MIKRQNQRLRFVITLSVFATLYGSILAFRLLRHEADMASDMAKMCAVILLGTLVFSAFWWSVITPKIKGAWGGAIAALLTGICIIPVPTFLGGAKSTLSGGHSFSEALYLGLKYSISTLSLAELIAPPLCAITGYILSLIHI